jgi:hypothetical protein
MLPPSSGQKSKLTMGKMWYCYRERDRQARNPEQTNHDKENRKESEVHCGIMIHCEVKTLLLGFGLI